MSEIERKPFEMNVRGEQHSLTLGMCAVVMFRINQAVDYLAVDLTEEGEEDKTTLRIFNNEDMVRWMAGYAIIHREDGVHRQTIMMNGETFREQHGWNPVVIEKETPSDTEEEMWLDVQARDVDKEWEQFREHPREQ